MKVGVHTSIAGALENAAHHAKKIGCDTFQMFSANPRGWRALDPRQADYEAFRAARHAHVLSPVVIHDNYLINLASSDSLIRGRSIAAFRKELERASGIGRGLSCDPPRGRQGRVALGGHCHLHRITLAGGSRIEARRLDHPD